MANGYYPVNPILKFVTHSLVMFDGGAGVMMRTIDEHANAGDRLALIVEVGLDVDIGCGLILRQIGKPVTVLVQVVEELALR